MKSILFAALLALALPSFAQTNIDVGANNASDSRAVNSGVSTTFNSYGTPLSIVDTTGRQDFHTNQAASAAPAFGVQGIGCVKPGKGFTVQLPGAGGSMALTGDMDDGCEAPRDINTMTMAGPGVFSEDDKGRRACVVPAIAKASPDKCRKLLTKALPPQAAQLPPPYTAGG